MTDKKSMWNEAGVAGLALGAVSSAYMYLGGISGTVLTMVLWFVKFAACIYLMRFFMLKYSNNNPDTGHSEVFRFGTLVALLSALIYAAFSLAYLMYINPESLSEAMDSAMEMYESFLDSNSLESIEEMLPKLPTISFWTNLFYCWIFGTVLAAIFSRNIPSDNPFDGIEDSNTNEQ